ncbi:hypothetical protein KDA11_00965 [Candidatus Saccharibacteria bacterium]|nr:hypothetical protein [Candidatus Saccharibacteria bacterium]
MSQLFTSQVRGKNWAYVSTNDSAKMQQIATQLDKYNISYDVKFEVCTNHFIIFVPQRSKYDLLYLFNQVNKKAS